MTVKSMFYVLFVVKNINHSIYLVGIAASERN